MRFRKPTPPGGGLSADSLGASVRLNHTGQCLTSLTVMVPALIMSQTNYPARPRDTSFQMGYDQPSFENPQSANHGTRKRKLPFSKKRGGPYALGTSPSAGKTRHSGVGFPAVVSSEDVQTTTEARWLGH